MANPEYSFIIPLFNEEKALPLLIKRLQEVISQSPNTFEIVLVDDGSLDKTGILCQQLALSDERIHSIILSKNHGHQIALTAGLTEAKATEAAFILDGDLQDPPELFSIFQKKLKEGFDIVYGIRKKRKENIIKKTAYYLFYRILNKLSFINIPLDSGDFSLISRRALDILKKMPEESRFIRGMRSWIGFNQIGIEYERDTRSAGDSKYPFSKLVKLALNGIFNFSEIPIRFITYLGLFTVLTSLSYLTFSLLRKLIYSDVPLGFTGLLITITLFGGVQLISIGILGEYIVRIFFQVKNRPLYIIKTRILKKQVSHSDKDE